MVQLSGIQDYLQDRQAVGVGVPQTVAQTMASPQTIGEAARNGVQDFLRSGDSGSPLSYGAPDDPAGPNGQPYTADPYGNGNLWGNIGMGAEFLTGAPVGVAASLIGGAIDYNHANTDIAQGNSAYGMDMPSVGIGDYFSALGNGMTFGLAGTSMADRVANGYRDAFANGNFNVGQGFPEFNAPGGYLPGEVPANWGGNNADDNGFTGFAPGSSTLADAGFGTWGSNTPDQATYAGTNAWGEAQYRDSAGNISAGATSGGSGGGWPGSEYGGGAYGSYGEGSGHGPGDE